MKSAFILRADGYKLAQSNKWICAHSAIRFSRSELLKSSEGVGQHLNQLDGTTA